MRGSAIAALMLGFLCMIPPAWAEEKCQLIRVASLDIGPNSTHVTVQAAIGDQPLTMIVDTGGVFTMLSQSKATALGLPVDIEAGSNLVMFGGQVIRRFATFKDFTLGRMKAPRFRYPLLPDGFLPPDVDGILSPDFLANFDLDFDFANAKLNLFSRDHCEGKVVYWTHDPDAIAKISLTKDEMYHIFIHVQLDGQDFKALIDTGAERSTMSLESAEDAFDISDDSSKLQHVPGPNNTKNARRYPFKQLSFANVMVNNPDITLVPDKEAGMGPSKPDLIIGMGILRQLHLYIAYGEKTLYLTAASAH